MVENWGAVMGTFLALSLLIEYASLAGDLAHNHVPILTFIHYWLWNLPPFLSVVLPLAFLLGGVLALSDAAVTREWVALRAGGASLVQWCRAGVKAWGAIIVLTFLLQAFLAPFAFRKADPIYRHILARSVQSPKTKPWLNLGSTGVVWFLDGAQRWGFPQGPRDRMPHHAAPGNAAKRSLALPWDGLPSFRAPGRRPVPGPRLAGFRRGRGHGHPGSVPLAEMVADPERATLFLSRLLGFLAGPCPVRHAALRLPLSARRARPALGYSLVAGLVFMGLQALFTGAAKAGEFPPLSGHPVPDVPGARVRPVAPAPIVHVKPPPGWGAGKGGSGWLRSGLGRGGGRGARRGRRGCDHGRLRRRGGRDQPGEDVCLQHRNHADDGAPRDGVPEHLAEDRAQGMERSYGSS